MLPKYHADIFLVGGRIHDHLQFLGREMRYHKIPEEAVRRLPLYLRAALELAAQGADRISSQRLADHLGLTPWLIRKDFSYFGDLGTRGVGYDTEALVHRIRKILRLVRQPEHEGRVRTIPEPGRCLSFRGP